MKLLIFLGFYISIMDLLASADEPILLIQEGEMGDVIAYPKLDDDDESDGSINNDTPVEEKIPTLTPDNISNFSVAHDNEPIKLENQPIEEPATEEPYPTFSAGNPVADACHFLPQFCDRLENERGKPEVKPQAIEEKIPPKTDGSVQKEIKTHKSTTVQDKQALSNSQIQIPNRFNDENQFVGNHPPYPGISETYVPQSDVSKGKYFVSSSYNYSSDEKGYDVEYHYKSTFTKQPI